MQDEINSVINRIDKCSLADRIDKFYRFRLLEPEEDDNIEDEETIINNFILKEERERRDVKQFSKISNYYLNKLKNNNISKTDNKNLEILFKKLRKKIIIYNHFLLFDSDNICYEYDTLNYKRELEKASKYFKSIKISVFTALKNWETSPRSIKKKVLKDAINFFNCIREILLEIYEDESLYDDEKFDIFLDTMKNL